MFTYFSLSIVYFSLSRLFFIFYLLFCEFMILHHIFLVFSEMFRSNFMTVLFSLDDDDDVRDDDIEYGSNKNIHDRRFDVRSTSSIFFCIFPVQIDAPLDSFIFALSLTRTHSNGREPFICYHCTIR